MTIEKKINSGVELTRHSKYTAVRQFQEVITRYEVSRK